ncbi:hypothetical protein PTKIN_Ptkin07bG0242400 [Pterospermum kingtungense]
MKEGKGEKFGEKCIRYCPVAMQVWILLKFDWDLGASDLNPGINPNWFETLRKLSSEQMQQFGFTLWTLWNERNWRSAVQRDAQLLSDLTVKWEPPVGSFVKVNFDGAFDKNSNTWGIGIVIRNSEELVMAEKASKVLSVADSFTVEALAAIQAMYFAFESGFRHVSLEGDALCVIKGLRGWMDDLSPIGHIIEKGRSLKVFFPNCKFLHVKRQENMAAHILARLGLHRDEDEIWLEDCPDCIHAQFSLDMNQ